MATLAVGLTWRDRPVEPVASTEQAVVALASRPAEPPAPARPMVRIDRSHMAEEAARVQAWRRYQPTAAEREAMFARHRARFGARGIAEVTRALDRLVRLERASTDLRALRASREESP